MPIERHADPLGPIGLILPTFVQGSAPSWVTGSGDDPLAALRAQCAGLEGAGADALWACDHLYWHGPSLECMTALTVASTATERVHLGTCIVQLPLRSAAAVAKQAASLQTLSRGRFVLGVGVGVHAGEYEQVGADFHTRGDALDKGIAHLRRSWTGDNAGTGADTGTARYRQLPEPPAVPVWVGGSSEPALRRAAASADGWMPLFLGVNEYHLALERLAKEVDKAGRPADAVTPAIVLFVSIDQDREAAHRRGTSWMGSLYGLPAKAFSRHLVSGTAGEVAGTVAAYQRAGARHVVLYVTADQPITQFEQLIDALKTSGAETASGRR